MTGTRVTCVGGGHGLAATLRSVRPWASDIVAVVSVADDGGSSGRLRHDPGIIPPGDLRRCLSALAEPGSILGAALEHRFRDGELEEHALGNVLIAGLVEHGLDVEAALAEVGRLVGASGRVLPAASVGVTLTGVGPSATSVEGQVRVQHTSGVRRVRIAPADAPSPPSVRAAIVAADLVVLGPGSLLTSVLAAAVVPGVLEALQATTATRALVVNLGPQRGEAEGLSPDDHVRIVADHDVPVDVVLADPRFAPTIADIPAVVAPVGVEGSAVHDPGLLGPALRSLVYRR